ncbi:zinc metallopeptidase [Pseudoroseomonas rhizosphaerae]|uniref:Zinc metallopeptidase n=1 Tax=Teichococcus rhizosphaerae TaxID=1335062 RepID=A0A2C7AET7_9PROT|nr:zinc metallopeptidase [Pseudoroseomonas rhizosphaerae]
MPAAPAPAVSAPTLPISAPPSPFLACPSPFLACTVRWRPLARARHVSLRIDPVAGEVVVVLPPSAGRREGLALLRRHAAWVARELEGLAPRRPFRPGALVPLGDVPHRLLHRPERPDGRAELRRGRILVGGAAEALPRRVLELLRAEAARRIAPHAGRHAAALAVAPRAIRLKDTRSRWGSCAPDGTLAFSWRLAMAPDWVLDSVVAHEVAHLAEPNHSPRFWATLDRLAPRHAGARDWLRRHGPGLLRVG